MTQPSPLSSTLIVGPEDAAEYLLKMDIDPAWIATAISNGEVAAGNITTDHPITAAGLVRWIEVVGALRRQLTESDKWDRDNPQNRPISKRRGTQFTLSTVGGDEATGITDSFGPKAARRKGKATGEAVNGVMSLISIETLRGNSTASDSPDTPPSGNWFLVYHRAEDEIRLEVSLPRHFDVEAGQFDDWQVRVILDSWKPDGISGRKPQDVGGQDVDFRVIEAG
ncbi:MAG: hypothetical protein U5O16_38150 [Rhodococcus sp. (in: high G+C Gram-positive bacteria)]|uniref:hypothetical protein n=1 Tax=Rhodococcus sp. TaxID=1831 RepID=UPI002AD9D280|nr:hypothetical protein [Rhodococcus sp. (in: high G+C Gram-positive bacteria)]